MNVRSALFALVLTCLVCSAASAARFTPDNLSGMWARPLGRAAQATSFSAQRLSPQIAPPPHVGPPPVRKLRFLRRGRR